MLVSTKDQGLGRRRRSYSHSSIFSNGRAASKLSLVSLVSSSSNQSNGSTGSNSTVTPASYRRSEITKRKRSKRKKDTSEEKTTAMEAVDEEASIDHRQSSAEVDVFDFLVEENGAEHNRLKVAAERHITVYDDDQERELASRSIHSDSGVSMDEGIYHLGLTTLKPLIESVRDEQHQRPTTSSGASPLLRSDWKWPDAPRPSQISSLAPYAGGDHAKPSLDVRKNSAHHFMDPYSACYTPVIPDFKQLPPSALYDLLASSSPEIAESLRNLPLRRFKTSDTRVLLHLQQDIHQLERDLRELDSAILASQSPESAAASSRRLSWQLNGPHLHSERVEVLHRLQLRLETYYKQLTMSRKVDQLGKAAKPESWRRKVGELRSMVKDDLTQATSKVFLDIFDDEDDYIHNPHIPTKRSADDLYCLAGFTVATTTLIPLLLFKIFNSILNRVLVIGATIVISLCAIEKVQAFASTIIWVGIHVPSIQDQDRTELRRWVVVGSVVSLILAIFG